MAAEDAVKTAIDELSNALSVKSIIGEPIEMEDKIIIPVTKIGMGFGAGTNQRAENKSIGGIAGGAGGGGGIFPVAVVIIFKGIKGPEGIRVIPLTSPSANTELAGSMTKIASTVLSKLNIKKEANENKLQGTSHAAKVKIK